MARTKDFTKYTYRPYDARFPDQYQRERWKLKQILPKSSRIEHFGSTSVKGLGGKGIIDVMVAVPKKDIKLVTKRLIAQGYKRKSGIGTPLKLRFVYDYHYGGEIRRVHIYVTHLGSREWDEALAVRDYLREHWASAREFARIKREAANLSRTDGDFYKRYKHAFLENLVEQALLFRKSKLYGS